MNSDFSSHNHHFDFIEPKNTAEREKDCTLPGVPHIFLPLALL